MEWTQKYTDHFVYFVQFCFLFSFLFVFGFVQFFVQVCFLFCFYFVCFVLFRFVFVFCFVQLFVLFCSVLFCFVRELHIRLPRFLSSHLADGDPRQLRPPSGAPLPHLPDPPWPPLPPGQAHQPQQEEGGDPSGESRAAALRSILSLSRSSTKLFLSPSLQGPESTVVSHVL